MLSYPQHRKWQTETFELIPSQVFMASPHPVVATPIARPVFKIDSRKGKDVVYWSESFVPKYTIDPDINMYSVANRIP